MIPERGSYSRGSGSGKARGAGASQAAVAVGGLPGRLPECPYAEPGDYIRRAQWELQNELVGPLDVMQQLYSDSRLDPRFIQFFLRKCGWPDGYTRWPE